jgi:hypothetical protein
MHADPELLERREEGLQPRHGRPINQKQLMMNTSRRGGSCLELGRPGEEVLLLHRNCSAPPHRAITLPRVLLFTAGRGL